MTTLKRLFDVASARFERGNLDGAEPLLVQILEQHPGELTVMMRLADIAIERQQYDRAVTLLGQTANLSPDNAEVLTRLGRAYLGQGRLQDGITCLERASILAPAEVVPKRCLADALRMTRDLHRALETATAAAALSPEDAKVHATMGHVYLELRLMEQAIQCYERSVAIDPDNWQVYGNWGIALIFLGRLEEAKAILMFSNALHPMHPEVALPLAGVLVDLGEHRDAAVILTKLQAMMPMNAKVLLYAGINAFKQGDLKTAVNYYILASSMEEDNDEITLKLIEALRQEGKVENAVSLLNQLVESQTSRTTAYVQKAKAELLLGHIETAAATIATLQSTLTTDTDIPLWEGADISRKRILLYAAFGLESFNVLFRLIKAVKQRGATVCIECPEPFLSLVTNVDFVDEAFLAGQPAPMHDVHAPFELLLHHLQVTEHTVADGPVFEPRPEQTHAFETRFSDIEKPKVGIMWRRETDLRPDIYHSIPLEAFGPLFENTSVQFISMQTQCGVNELKSFERKDQLQHQDDIENAFLDERLACAASLDLLITPDTLTGQVAASAGLPVWFLLGTVPDWHFGLNDAHSVWHPGARLFRQSEIGRWDDVMKAVAEALQTYFD